MTDDSNQSLRTLLGPAPPSSVKALVDALSKGSPRSRWAPRFDTWARPLSNTEEQKCQNAETMIRSAVDGHRDLIGLDLRVFAQGSYRANTNVRADSDVDICVRCANTFHYEAPPELIAQNYFNSPATLNYATYRSKVGRALYDKFTIYGVSTGDKAFKVKENTYRINADVVPVFEYRHYYWQGASLMYRTGTCFFSASGKFIVNWPEQTLANGIAKNGRTGKRYKKVVRVLKGLRNEMEAKGYISAKKISSFQLSCLAYNVPDDYYGKEDLYDDVKAVVGAIWYNTYDPSRSSAWTEVDEIKPLFPIEQPGKAKEVADFFWDVMKYAELEILAR